METWWIAACMGGTSTAVAAAWGARMRSRLRAERTRARQLERGDAAILAAVRALTRASMESCEAVHAALARSLQAIAPGIDAMLVFEVEGDELRCAFTSGGRGEHCAGMRVHRAETRSIPALAAARGCRAGLEGARALLPTDRFALAVPLADADGVCAVVYLAASSGAVADVEEVVRLVEHATEPLALARERERDRRRATFDALTGLLTPRAFRERLHELIAAARFSPSLMACLWFIDTDHFKRVNDTFGHAAGDAVLQRMARLLSEHTVAGVDLVGRNGGDEFCAIVRDVPKSVAIERAQAFCKAVRACDFGVDAAVSASVGVAAFPFDARSASELLELADAAMYHSKRSGRDRVSFALDPGTFAVYS